MYVTTLFDGVRQLATSAYKPARLGKSLLLGLSQRSGQTYPLVADRVASQPYFIFRFWLRRPCMGLRLQEWLRYRLRFGSFPR